MMQSQEIEPISGFMDIVFQSLSLCVVLRIFQSRYACVASDIEPLHRRSCQVLRFDYLGEPQDEARRYAERKEASPLQQEVFRRAYHNRMASKSSDGAKPKKAKSSDKTSPQAEGKKRSKKGIAAQIADHPDNNDIYAAKTALEIKKERNRLAAKEARVRKKEHMKDLETKFKERLEKNLALRQHVADSEQMNAQIMQEMQELQQLQSALNGHPILPSGTGAPMGFSTSFIMGAETADDFAGAASQTDESGIDYVANFLTGVDADAPTPPTVPPFGEIGE